MAMAGRITRTVARCQTRCVQEPERFEVVVLEVLAAEVERLVGDPRHRLAVRAHVRHAALELVEVVGR